MPTPTEDAMLLEVARGNVKPHVATRMEVGAILSASWGFDQTNVDWFCIIRVTDKSVWTLPMQSVATETIGWSSWMVMPGAVRIYRDVSRCLACDHRRGIHDEGRCWEDDCPCTFGLYRQALIPDRHRKGPYIKFSDSVAAGLWDGQALYASSYS